MKNGSRDEPTEPEAGLPSSRKKRRGNPSVHNASNAMEQLKAHQLYEKRPDIGAAARHILTDNAGMTDILGWPIAPMTTYQVSE